MILIKFGGIIPPISNLVSVRVIFNLSTRCAKVRCALVELSSSEGSSTEFTKSSSTIKPTLNDGSIPYFFNEMICSSVLTANPFT